MPQRFSLTALVVHDYDDAIDFYVRKLGFKLAEDTDQGHGKRWVVVRPPGSQAGLLLAKATDARQADRVGDRAGIVVAERRWLHKAFDHGGASLRQTGARLAISGEPCLNPKKKKSPKYETLQNLTAGPMVTAR